MKRVEELVTRRLLLRPFRAADLQDLYDCLSDPEVVRFEPYPPATWAKAEAALRERMAGGDMLAVERREDGRVIGNVCLGGREFEALELGYLLRRCLLYTSGYVPLVRDQGRRGQKAVRQPEAA